MVELKYIDNINGENITNKLIIGLPNSIFNKNGEFLSDKWFDSYEDIKEYLDNNVLKK